MKAVVHDRYGPPDVLRLEEVDPPVPQADEVLVRIRATTVNRTDCHRLKLADVGPGTRVLVYGASGSIGTAAVQLARHFGADVTAVCNSKNVEIVRSLGAGQVIDYTREDFTASGQTYDVICDAVGKHSFRRCAGSLKPGGKYLATDGLQNVVLAVWTARLADKKVVFPVPPRYTKQDVLFLGGLIEAGEYRPVIDRCYPLEQVVEATRYVETRQKTGNVVLTVSGDRR
jgi:NADPH:quinone reductase-like Zn-dependent oxidoreductase